LLSADVYLLEQELGIHRLKWLVKGDKILDDQWKVIAAVKRLTHFAGGQLMHSLSSGYFLRLI